MKHLKKLFSKHKVASGTSKVLPPESTPPLQTLLEQIEGYINAINLQKQAFDTSGIRFLCQSQNIDPVAIVKLQALSTAIAAYGNDVNSCLGLANS